jgi:hypothetical protein
MADIFGENSTVFTNLKTIIEKDGGHKLLSNGISSLNFDGSVPKITSTKQVANIKAGDTLFLNDPYRSVNQVLITQVEKKTFSSPTVSIASTGSLVTITTSTPSNLAVGDTVIVSGVSPSGYNTSGSTVTAVSNTSPFTVQYANTTTGAQTVSGTVSNPENYFFLYYLSSENINEPFTYQSTFSHVDNGITYYGYNEQDSFDILSDDIENVLLGNDGWSITNNGNAVFSNVFVRGRIEATDGIFDGTLTAGFDENGTALVTIGKDIFNENEFFTGKETADGVLIPDITSGIEANGLYINSHTFLLSYNKTQNLAISNIVAVNGTSVNTTNYFATITYSTASFTPSIAVGDVLYLNGMPYESLNGLKTVTGIGSGTFTVSAKDDIGSSGTTALAGFAENGGFEDQLSLTSMVSSTTTTTTLKSNLTINFTDTASSNNFSVNDYVQFSTFTNATLDPKLSNQLYKVTSKGTGYVVIACDRITAATYSSGLGTVDLVGSYAKFGVGGSTNYLDYSSESGILTVTGTINATSGTFSGSVKTGGTQNIKIDGPNNGIYFSNATGTSYPAYLKPYNDGTKTEGISFSYQGPTYDSTLYLANNIVRLGVGTNSNIYVDSNSILISPASTCQISIGSSIITSGTITLVNGSGNGAYPPVYDGLTVSGSTARVYLPATSSAATTTSAANLFISTTSTPDGLITRSSSSSRRYKNNITDTLDFDPNNILDIDVVQFKFNNDYLSEDDPNYDKFVIGLIAEDVFEKYPLAADLNDDGTAENWNPRFLIPAMLKVIQDLEKRIALLEDK